MTRGETVEEKRGDTNRELVLCYVVVLLSTNRRGGKVKQAFNHDTIPIQKNVPRTSQGLSCLVCPATWPPRRRPPGGAQLEFSLQEPRVLSSSRSPAEEQIPMFLSGAHTTVVQSLPLKPLEQKHRGVPSDNTQRPLTLPVESTVPPQMSMSVSPAASCAPGQSFHTCFSLAW